ncbi:hypothetical protein V1511DRAFT_236908 [Dipodascopsis uninucleata]
MRYIGISASRYKVGLLPMRYLARVTPGLSTAILILFSICGINSCFFIIFTIFCHMFVVSFAIRSCVGMFIVSRELRRKHLNIGSNGYVSDDTNTLMAYEQRPLHAIFIPNYKESFDTLRETLSMLASHALAKIDYEIYLSMEQNEKAADTKAHTLISEYSKYFRHMSFTIHPSGVTGEATGKSSNINWATRSAAREIRSKNDHKRKYVLTIMDADTHLLPCYFESIGMYYMTTTDTNEYIMFIPPIVFDRNADAIAPIVRCADMLWSAAGIASLYESSRIITPTSVYSVSLSLAESVDFWDSGPEAIGEDLHMFLKCYFETDGRMKTVPIFSPASHCNVAPEVLNSGTLAWLSSSHKARFRQACRHMWGMVDSGYTIRRTVGLFVKFEENKDYSLPQYGDDKAVSGNLSNGFKFGSRISDYWRLLVLLHRMYEAHFLPLHYFIDVLACSILPIISNTSPSKLASSVLFYTAHLRTAAYIGVVIQTALYERFHASAVRLRRKVINSALSSTDLDDDGRDPLKHIPLFDRESAFYLIDYILFPIAGTIFGAIPALKTQILQFWTDNYNYEVSLKPSNRQRL